MDDKGDSTPRQGALPTKRREPGDDDDKSAPDQVGEGLFKAGTQHINGIFCCPADMPFDTPEGHTQSVVLDEISEALTKLHKMRQEITGDKSDNILSSWVKIDDATQSAAASSAPRVKRPALGGRDDSQGASDK